MADASCDPMSGRARRVVAAMAHGLMGFADVEVMLFQSKFGAAANMRASIPLGLRESGRAPTHWLVAPRREHGRPRRSA